MPSWKSISGKTHRPWVEYVNCCYDMMRTIFYTSCAEPGVGRSKTERFSWTRLDRTWQWAMEVHFLRELHRIWLWKTSNTLCVCDFMHARSSLLVERSVNHMGELTEKPRRSKYNQRCRQQSRIHPRGKNCWKRTQLLRSMWSLHVLTRFRQESVLKTRLS